MAKIDEYRRELAATDDWERYRFLAACGTAGLGRLVSGGRRDLLPTLRSRAGDERWRVREAVAMALQRWGDDDLPAMLDEIETWTATPLERRAAVAAAAEPRLLRSPAAVERALALLERATSSLAAEPNRVLRQALGYAWSVVVAADPEHGLPRFARLEASDDRDVKWIVRENLRKARLKRLRR
jgi:hypothetical protein